MKDIWMFLDNMTTEQWILVGVVFLVLLTIRRMIG